MTPIVVYCGNGGDYEFERDRAWWRKWIEQNLVGCGPFVIKPHEEADKAYIIFEAEKWNSIFLLKAPQFISHKYIADYEC
jgi:hypothetical protein